MKEKMDQKRKDVKGEREMKFSIQLYFTEHL